MQKEITITCAGGALSVTGANFLVQGFEKTFLVDCGLEQGSKMAEETNWKPFPYKAEEIDILFITHAHLDHIGKIPKLVFDGFQGKIISTAATRDIAEIMLEDTASILGASESGKAFRLGDMYNARILRKVFSLWETVEYHEKFVVCEGLSLEMYDAGHILGSAMLVFDYKGQHFVFSGDLGNSPSPLLADTEKIPDDTKYLLMESVYGDRNHEERDMRRDVLKRVLKENTERGGVLLVPIFSLERTQEFLYEINEMVEGGEIPRIPIILDSPLALRVTDIFYRYKHLFKESVRKDIASGDDIFDFPGLKETMHTRESKAIDKIPNPKVILAGAGMSTGGRIVHHEKKYLSDPNTTVLITGFQTPGSLGRLLQDGAKQVVMFEETIAVRAKIETVRGYSGHKDSNGLVSFVEPAVQSLQTVFVAMGEMMSSTFLAQRLHDELGIKAKVAQTDEVLRMFFEE